MDTLVVQIRQWQQALLTTVVWTMKQYRLTAWPDLRAPFQRTAYRRILSDMSHRYVTVQEMAGMSGLKRREVRSFIDMLCHSGLIGERVAEREASLFTSAWRSCVRRRAPAAGGIDR